MPPIKTTWEQVEQAPISILSPAYKSNGHVFTSGSVGSDANGVIPDSVELQTEIAIKNLEKVLVASGSSLDKVMKVLLFIADGSDAAAVNSVYSKYFPHAPARSCVIVAFPNKQIKVELESVAFYKDIE